MFCLLVLTRLARKRTHQRNTNYTLQGSLVTKTGGRRPGDKGVRVDYANVAHTHDLFLVDIQYNSVGYFYACTVEISLITHIIRRPWQSPSPVQERIEKMHAGIKCCTHAIWVYSSDA
jgi:hypothetical protein